MRKKIFLKKIEMNKWIIFGLVSIFLIIYADVFFGTYKVSFTNIMYIFPPFSSMDVAIKGPLLSDVTDQNYTVLFNYIHQFDFSFWNPDVMLGVPLAMWFYLFPLHYLYLLPLGVAIFLISITKFLIGFVGMYLLVKNYGVNKSCAFISGIIYTFSSVLVCWHGWPHSSVAILAPYLFMLLNKFFETLKLSYLFWLTLLTYLALVAGMPTYTAYFLYVLGLYALIYGILRFSHNKKKLLFCIIGFMLSMLLAIIISLPYTGDLLTSVGTNGYSESRKYMSSLSLDFQYLRTMVFPYIRNVDWLDHSNESTLYTGILSVVLLPLSFINRNKKPKINFWLLVTIVLYLSIFTDVFNIVYSHLPMINSSYKPRLMVLINFALPILVGLNLNDLLKNRKYYIKRKFYVSIALLIPLILFFIAMFTLWPFFQLNHDELSEVYRISFVLVGLIITIIGLLNAKTKKVKKAMIFLISVLCIFDMGIFAKNYIPLIDKNAEIIPKPTDSIKFLQDNTKNNEKIMAFGTWTFFPSSNTFYNLRDIRGHDFLLTNTDISTYYKKLSSDAFDTKTRVSFEDITEINLLKYMGVKYMISDQIDTLVNIYKDKVIKPEITLSDIEPVEQEFISEIETMNQIFLTINTSEHHYDDETVNFDIIDSDDNQIVASTEIAAKNIVNNRYMPIQFATIKNAKDRKFILRITTDIKQDQQLTLYTFSDEESEMGELGIEEEQGEESLALIISNYPQFRLGTDGLYIKEMEEYVDQVELVYNIVIESSDQSVLNSMSKEFENNTLFLEKTVAKKIDLNEISTQPLSERETISKITNKKNGNLIFNTNFEKARLVTINEYNDGNWAVYIDGNKQTDNAYIGNYMMRTIKVPQGSHEVELRYRPVVIINFIKISIFGVIVYIILLLFRKKLECLISVNSKNKL